MYNDIIRHIIYTFSSAETTAAEVSGVGTPAESVDGTTFKLVDNQM